MVKNRAKAAFALYLALLAAYTAYGLLDTFVIARGLRQAEEVQREAAGEPVITLSTMRAYDSTVHVAEIVVSDARQILAAFAQNTYGRNITQTVSDMAQAQGARLAINGDYYGAQRSGYVIRNGSLYRESVRSAAQEDLCLWADGSMTLIREGETTAQALLDAGAWQVFSFGPGLMENGEIIVGEDDEVGKAMVSNPRTAIAMVEPLHYLLVVADGRTDESDGLSLYELAQVLQGLGAQVAYNLDGGGSSTMVHRGEVVNYPTTNGRYRERAVSDIVYVE